MAFDVAAYLARIGYRGTVVPDSETLRALQIQHLRTVPFENLDIHSATPIALDEASLFDKIVVRRRGGFCYELNGLFALLLEAMGFDVTRVSASDAHSDGSFGREFDHLALLVDVPGMGVAGERWLADVGWGDTFVVPLRLEHEPWQVQGERAYRIEWDGEHRVVCERHRDGREEKNYRFRLEPRALADFADMCLYHQVSPESPFTRKRLCTMATPEGRITLDDERLIVIKDGVRREQTIATEEEFVRHLEERFGIEELRRRD